MDNRLMDEDVLGLEVEHIVVATGSAWRRDGVGRGQYAAVTRRRRRLSASLRTMSWRGWFHPGRLSSTTVTTTTWAGS